jgi:signal transduction histidine kinase
VFQLQLQTNGQLNCLFTSKAVIAVCGEEESADSHHWIPCISNLHPGDRESFFSAMNLSARELTHWNWEGRIIVPPGDEKWINLRAVPCIMPDGATVWDGIILNITLSKRREDESRHARQALEKLSGHIQRAREEERLKISREIHDELGGILTALKMDLGWLSKHLVEPPLLERAQAMTQLTRQALHTARRISADLRPNALDNLGLVAAMEEYAQQVLGRLGITCIFTLPEQEPEMDEQRAIAIFRIVQESVTNIVRHAEATLVEIQLVLSPSHMNITIRDNGTGMPSSRHPHAQSYGILGMQERARQLGGKLAIISGIQEGTEVSLNVPLLATGKQHDD